MIHRDTYFEMDVTVEGDADLIAMADDEQLTRKATDQLRDAVGDAAVWFEPTGVDDATVTFELRVGTAHRGEPTEAGAIHAALRCVREHVARVDGDLDCSMLRFDRVVAPDDNDSESDTESDNVNDNVNDSVNDSASDNETSSDSESANELDTDGQTGLLSGAMGGGGGAP